MKRFAALVFLALAVVLPRAHAQQDPDDQYVIIYSLIQRADSLAQTGQPQQALAQYAEVQGDLQKFQKLFPDWSPKIVSFRLNYLAEKIAGLTAQFPATNAPPQMAATSNAIAPANNAANAADLESQLNNLRAQEQNLQADNTTLQAKLKEALAAQPAMIDSRELTKAQDQIQSLMKENDLLKANLAEEKTGASGGAETNSSSQAQQALAGANQKLSEQTGRADKLAQENQALQARVQTLTGSPDAIEALREENALLQKQMAGLKSAATNSVEASAANAEAAKAHAQIAALQADISVRSLEKTGLENRVRQLEKAAADQTENEKRIRDLTQERDDLLAKLGEANKQIYGNKKQDAAARISELTDEMNTLRARLAVDEAQAVPYTPEELALFKQPAPQLAANPDAGKKSVNELPSGAAALAAEAQNYFSDRQYDKAGDDYQKILQQDQNNALVLANLATIEVEQNKLDGAEKHIKAALAQNPDDAYDLSILGHIEFLRGKYDDAQNILSRAAKLDPQSPEIENYLGVTLAQKGLRAQAETVLRKAIQLDPSDGPAHNNLAVIYASQQPPMTELARWHYQKALDAGQPHNPDLEKMLADQGAPVNPP
ncbi:MAG TPA: tetratricopeptide repeat protein [Verrucomicrobiae bacterium]|jgi:Flp pilus assembly protein TadD